MSKKKNKKARNKDQELEKSPSVEKTEVIVSAVPGDSGMKDQSVKTSPLGKHQNPAESSTSEKGDIDDAAASPSDDLLEDVRRNLIEHEVEEKKQKSKSWWGRVGKPFQRESESDDETKSKPNAVSEEGPSVKVQLVEASVEEYEEEIEELIELLEEESIEEPVANKQVDGNVEKIDRQSVEIEAPAVSVEEMKKRAFSGAEGGRGESEDFGSVRMVALEGDEEDVFIEVEAKTEDPMDDRWKAFQNALLPYRRYINIGFGFFALFVIFAFIGVVYGSSTLSFGRLKSEEAEQLPYPVGVNLPGGVGFSLGVGKIQNGVWDPRQPEWLEGTEVCRWVAIPWSIQTEAVIRTLTRDDSIELVMNNGDRFRYSVYSRNLVNINDLEKLDTNSPCLLLVLAKAETEDRWVVTAFP